MILCAHGHAPCLKQVCIHPPHVSSVFSPLGRSGQLAEPLGSRQRGIGHTTRPGDHHSTLSGLVKDEHQNPSSQSLTLLVAAPHYSSYYKPVQNFLVSLHTQDPQTKAPVFQSKTGVLMQGAHLTLKVANFYTKANVNWVFANVNTLASCFLSLSVVSGYRLFPMGSAIDSLTEPQQTTSRGISQRNQVSVYGLLTLHFHLKLLVQAPHL